MREQKGKKGVIKTQSPVNYFWVNIEKEGIVFVEIPSNQNSLVYLISGAVKVNHLQSLEYEKYNVDF